MTRSVHPLDSKSALPPVAARPATRTRIRCTVAAAALAFTTASGTAYADNPAAGPQALTFDVLCGERGVPSDGFDAPKSTCPKNQDGWFWGHVVWYSGNTPIADEAMRPIYANVFNEGTSWIHLILDGDGDPATFDAYYVNPATSILTAPDLSLKLYWDGGTGPKGGPPRQPANTLLSTQRLKPQATALWATHSQDTPGLLEKIADEASRATSAEDALSSRITSEEARASLVESVEAARALAAEAGLAAQSESETSRAKAAEATELARATAAEGALADGLALESGRASGAEQALQMSLSAETGRAIAAEANAWSILGNAGTSSGVHFIGTTDVVPLSFQVAGKLSGRMDPATQNSWFGYFSGNPNIVGFFNSALGSGTMQGLTSGSYNTAVGTSALQQATTASDNTAVGAQAMRENRVGRANVAIGTSALVYNQADGNTATGHLALGLNGAGGSNSAFGNNALYSNETGNFNTGLGSYANVASGSLTNATAIGYAAVVDASNKIRLGNGNVTLVETAGRLSASAATFVGNVTAASFSGSVNGATLATVTNNNPAVSCGDACQNTGKGCVGAKNVANGNHYETCSFTGSNNVSCLCVGW